MRNPSASIRVGFARGKIKTEVARGGRGGGVTRLGEGPCAGAEKEGRKTLKEPQPGRGGERGWRSWWSPQSLERVIWSGRILREGRGGGRSMDFFFNVIGVGVLTRQSLSSVYRSFKDSIFKNR